MAKISKSKNLAAGVTKKIKKAGMVDPKGAYTKVQERTLGNTKNGGVKKAQNGKVETKKGNVSYSTDTTGLAAGKKMFPMTATNSKTGKVTKSSAPRVIVKRQVKESQVKKNSSGGKTSKKK